MGETIAANRDSTPQTSPHRYLCAMIEIINEMQVNLNQTKASQNFRLPRSPAKNGWADAAEPRRDRSPDDWQINEQLLNKMVIFWFLKAVLDRSMFL